MSVWEHTQVIIPYRRETATKAWRGTVNGGVTTHTRLLQLQVLIVYLYRLETANCQLNKAFRGLSIERRLWEHRKSIHLFPLTQPVGLLCVCVYVCVCCCWRARGWGGWVSARAPTPAWVTHQRMTWRLVAGWVGIYAWGITCILCLGVLSSRRVFASVFLLRLKDTYPNINYYYYCVHDTYLAIACVWKPWFPFQVIRTCLESPSTHASKCSLFFIIIQLYRITSMPQYLACMLSLYFPCCLNWSWQDLIRLRRHRLSDRK